MKFLEDLEKIHQAHKQLWLNENTDAEKIRIAEHAVWGAIGYLIEDIREHADRGDGPSRKIWYEVIRELASLARSIASTDRTISDKATRASMMAGLNSQYSEIASKIRTVN